MDRHHLSLAGRERLSILVVILAFLFLTGGLVRLQVVEYDELAKMSESNRIRVVPIEPRRGRMYDRNGRVIVDNRPSYTVSVVPAEEIRGKTIPNLSRLIGVDTIEIRRRMKRNMVSVHQPSPVKRDIPFEVVAVLEEQYEKFPGVTYQMERVRMYRDSLFAESYTGYVGEVSRDQLREDGDQELRLGAMIGKKGLEKQYDRLLRGREGTEFIEVYANGQILGPYEGREPVPAVPGADLRLTIDADLQLACARALDTFCCGAIVAMDPRTGEVLAMTSYPRFDANIFSSVIPEDLWLEITADSTHPLLNRPLVGQYPPGSTTKLVTVGAGLEEQVITENTLFKPCYGGYQFGNRFFRCWEEAGHGALNCVHSLEESCDVYMYQLGLKLGVDGLAKYYGLCGFGKLTGIDLPGEVPGLNPTSAYYDERYGKNKWTKGLVLNNSIGQGEILSTPLQLAQFYCGVANNGVVYRPHLVRKIIDPENGTQTVTPVKSFTLPFSPETLDLLMEGIRLVVEGEHGTARRLRNDLYSIGGKTGTSQNPHGNEHSLFVGVAPLEAPEIVVCAVVENAGHGSEVAAPVVGAVIKEYMLKRLGLKTIAAAPSEVAN
ncbi:penicillin-binding protein 2 [candidate division GN15 bacterium]|nr:penicillin-binding protein 2 [candidate division GN15 bacterium]